MGIGAWFERRWDDAKDTYHLARATVDSSYTRPLYREAAPTSPEKRAELEAQVRRAAENEAVVAGNVEMVTGTIVKTPIIVADAVGTVAGVITIFDPEPITKTIAAVGTAAAFGLDTEASYVLHHSGNNHAPLKTVFNTYIPPWIPLIGGDEHYYNGGTPMDHPLARVVPPDNNNPLAHMPIVKDLFFDSQESVGKQEAVKRLMRSNGKELTFADLDIDGDGVLTDKDKEKIRQVLRDNKLADELFRTLENQGIVFNGTIGAPASADVAKSPAASGSIASGASTVPAATPPGGEPGFFGKLWDSIKSFFAGIWDRIKSMFSGNASPPAGATAAKPAETGTSALATLGDLKPQHFAVTQESPLALS